MVCFIRRVLDGQTSKEPFLSKQMLCQTLFADIVRLAPDLHGGPALRPVAEERDLRRA
jgi:hypothetical protein